MGYVWAATARCEPAVDNVNGVLEEFLKNENTQLTKANLLWLNKYKKQSHELKIV